MLNILHIIDNTPSVIPKLRSTIRMKDINSLKLLSKSHSRHDENHNNILSRLSHISTVKKVIQLKRQIQRSRVILAKHAEENALEKYLSNISIMGQKSVATRKLHVIVIRIDANDQITESKPCSHCVDVMRSYGIRKVTYSTKSANFVTESLTTIITQPTVAYTSVNTAINVLDEMIESYSTYTLQTRVSLKSGIG